MPDKVYRTAIYCRLSREDGDKVESNSIASQRAICEDYIARHEDLELRRDLSRWFSAKGYQKSNGAATRHLYGSPSTI